jgi:hypothetical protein
MRTPPCTRNLKVLILCLIRNLWKVICAKCCYMRSDQPVLPEWSVVLFTYVASLRMPDLRVIFIVSFSMQIAVSTYANYQPLHRYELLMYVRSCYRKFSSTCVLLYSANKKRVARFPDFHHEVDKNCAILACYAACSGISSDTLHNNPEERSSQLCHFT